MSVADMGAGPGGKGALLGAIDPAGRTTARVELQRHRARLVESALRLTTLANTECWSRQYEPLQESRHSTGFFSMLRAPVWARSPPTEARWRRQPGEVGWAAVAARFRRLRAAIDAVRPGGSWNMPPALRISPRQPTVVSDVVRKPKGRGAARRTGVPS